MRAHEMIADLMLFARPPKLELAALDLRQIVRRVVDELRELAAERMIDLHCEVGDADQSSSRRTPRNWPLPLRPS